MAALTVRFPDELGEQLDRYCEANGCVKNRVVAIAVRTYLGADAPALPVARSFDELDPLPAREQAVLDELHRELDARPREAA